MERPFPLQAPDSVPEDYACIKNTVNEVATLNLLAFDVCIAPYALTIYILCYG
jgi:hypothetical protein